MIQAARRLLLGICLALGFAFQALAAWSETVYVEFPDKAAATTAAIAIGANFDEQGNPTSGSENYALKAPIVELDGNGDVRPGYWAMMRFNLDTQAGRDAYLAVIGTGAVQTLTNPSNVFQ